MAASFIPRPAFHPSFSLPRSYFLGHHASGLAKMRSMLSSIDLIIECRDYRVPLASRNPVFEEALAGRQRLIVYTKRDLGSRKNAADREREDLIQAWHKPSDVLFTSDKSKLDIKSVINYAKEFSYRLDCLTGTRILVVGMPNVGKSSLLNALRMRGVRKGKAARIGNQPGITRKIGSPVMIATADPDRGTEALYVLDTPGVFVPYVSNAESMLKLALVGCVKDTVIQPVELADYLLYHLNKSSPQLYEKFAAPTNDIMELLEAICQHTGMLKKNAEPEIEAAALWMVQRWRNGHLGRFLLDSVSQETLAQLDVAEAPTSLNQARKKRKEEQLMRKKSAQLRQRARLCPPNRPAEREAVIGADEDKPDAGTDGEAEEDVETGDKTTAVADAIQDVEVYQEAAVGRLEAGHDADLDQVADAFRMEADGAADEEDDIYNETAVDQAPGLPELDLRFTRFQGAVNRTLPSHFVAPTKNPLQLPPPRPSSPLLRNISPQTQPQQSTKYRGITSMRVISPTTEPEQSSRLDVMNVNYITCQPQKTIRDHMSAYTTGAKHRAVSSFGQVILPPHDPCYPRYRRRKIESESMLRKSIASMSILVSVLEMGEYTDEEEIISEAKRLEALALARMENLHRYVQKAVTPTFRPSPLRNRHDAGGTMSM